MGGGGLYRTVMAPVEGHWYAPGGVGRRVRSAYAATPNVTECDRGALQGELYAYGNRYCCSGTARLSQAGSFDCEFSREHIL